MDPKKLSQNVTLYCADPIIYVVEGFLSDEECEAFIEVGKDKVERSTVITDGEHEVHTARTSYNCCCLLYTSPSPRDLH